MSADKVRAIFVELISQVPPEQWDARLAELAGDDAELRARAAALLAAHRKADSFLEQPAQPLGKTVDAPASRDSRAAAEEVAGAVLAGRYKLLEEIGEGGMGAVWMAQQTEPVKRLVAVKLIKAGMDSKLVLARFEAERQALALMDHPNIAKVLEGGATASGRPFFVMELVKGVPLTKFCDEQRLTPRQRLELFIPVCQAIQHAHQKGIIHRDIKPSNVLVALYDGKPAPKVIDFGIAKASGQHLTERTLVTGFGAVIGTLEYMSPEQAERNQLDIDTRSDIYSLGVLLYELLTGTTPLEKKRLKEAAVLELLRLIREEEPPRPSTRLSESKESLPSISAQRHTEPAKLTKLVRGELDWIVMKALDKDRNRRYETANGFAMDVQRYLADEPVLACPPSAWYRFGKFARRNKGRLAVAAGLFLALTVMAVSIGWAVRDRVARLEEGARAELARRAEVERQVRASWTAARALLGENNVPAARQKLAEGRVQLGNDRLALDSLAREIEAGEADLNRFQEFLDLLNRAHDAETAPVLEAMVAIDGDRSTAVTPPTPGTWGRRPAAAVPFLVQALGRYEILERDDWTTTLEGGFLSRDQAQQIRRHAYEELLWLAHDLIIRQQGHRSGEDLSPQAAAQQALVYLGKAETAQHPTQGLHALRARCHKALGQQAAFQAERQRADQTPPTLAVDHYLRGLDAFEARQLAAGVQAFEAALRLEPTHYWSLMRLGECWSHFSRGPEDWVVAAGIFTGCILKRPNHANAYSNRAWAYLQLRRSAEGLADSSRAIELDPNDKYAWNNRGYAHSILGQQERALADYSRAIELDPKYAISWANRGSVYSILGQHEKAQADCSRAIELDSRHAPAWYTRGVAYDGLGQSDKAVADHSRAIELKPKDMRPWIGRGIAYLHLGQPDTALADHSKAIELDPKDAEAWNARGIAYLDLRQHAKAVADFSKAIELNPKNARPWTNRGSAYRHLGQPDKALADDSKAIELDPNYAPWWVNRGILYSHLRQYDKAVADSSRAIELDPKLVRAWTNRGLAYYQLGQPDKAVADLSRAIELDPKYAAAWVTRGNVYCDCLGQPDKAVADYSRAIELDPKLVPAWLNRGNAYGKLGQYDKAIADYETAIKLAPTDARAHNALAWLLATCPDPKLRDPKRAVENGKKAVQLAPRDGNNWGTLGAAHYRAGQWKEAIAALDESRSLKPGWDAHAWFFLAMAHRKLGHDDESRKAFDQAILWLESNQELLAKNKTQAEELRRFRSEAEEVLQLKK
jgi:tetratricopeptide (TPR) repeat protein